MGDAALLGLILFGVGIVLLVRIFGAWMLRINDVISELKGIRKDLKKYENRN